MSSAFLDAWLRASSTSQPKTRIMIRYSRRTDIEGACRHLVKDRLDITGARWGLTGPEAILRLRALITSGDFHEYWNFHLLKEHHRTHQTRYRHHPGDYTLAA
jgi:hypothetical protein